MDDGKPFLLSNKISHTHTHIRSNIGREFVNHFGYDWQKLMVKRESVTVLLRTFDSFNPEGHNDRPVSITYNINVISFSYISGLYDIFFLWLPLNMALALQSCLSS